MNKKIVEMRRKLAELRKERDATVAEAQRLNESGENSKQVDELIKRAEELQTRLDSGQTELEREEKIEAMGAQRAAAQSDGNIGMGEADLRKYSLLRAIRALASKDWRGADLEKEASDAVARQLGRDPQGFFVPMDWMRSGYSVANMERRDLTAGTNSAGGYTVATDVLASSFIELLRNRMMVRAAGATMLADLQGNVAIPSQSAGATAYWVAENGAPTESQQTLGQVSLTPKTVGAYTDYSRRLLMQSSIDVEAFVRSDLATVLALAIDLAALHGTGASNQPTGIAATSGIGSVAGGTNGLAPAWSHIVGLETEVAIDNADIGRLSYMTNAKVRGKLKQTAKVASTDSVMIWGDSDTPLNGYPAFVTNQVSSTLDKGTSTGVCSAIFFGNWADLLIGMWGGLDILVDPYTGSTAGTTRIVALQDVDVAVRHAQSFAAMLDALTA